MEACTPVSNEATGLDLLFGGLGADAAVGGGIVVPMPTGCTDTLDGELVELWLAMVVLLMNFCR